LRLSLILSLHTPTQSMPALTKSHCHPSRPPPHTTALYRTLHRDPTHRCKPLPPSLPGHHQSTAQPPIAVNCLWSAQLGHPWPPTARDRPTTAQLHVANICQWPTRLGRSLPMPAPAWLGHPSPTTASGQPDSATPGLPLPVPGSCRLGRPSPTAAHARTLVAAHSCCFCEY
jgi:hypothetical protein